MTARKRPPAQREPPVQLWYNAPWRWCGLTGTDGWLSFSKLVLLWILVWATAGNHWSDGLAGILVAASGGTALLGKWIDRAS